MKRRKEPDQEPVLSFHGAICSCLKCRHERASLVVGSVEFHPSQGIPAEIPAEIPFKRKGGFSELDEEIARLKRLLAEKSRRIEELEALVEAHKPVAIPTQESVTIQGSDMDPIQVALDPQPETLLAYLKQAGPSDREAILENVSVSSAYLEQLVAEGVIVRTGKGKRGDRYLYSCL